jgi:hypothetical protein
MENEKSKIKRVGVQEGGIQLLGEGSWGSPLVGMEDVVGQGSPLLENDFQRLQAHFSQEVEENEAPLLGSGFLDPLGAMGL